VNEFRPIHISGYARQPGDFYPTPAWVTECLLQHVELRGPIWEPCCGDGAIAKVLAARGHNVVASDLVDHGFGQAGVDIFQQSRMPEGCRALVTNPPYGGGGVTGKVRRVSREMLLFTEHALNLAYRASGQLALLVRLQWIAGQKVATLLSSSPLEAVIILTQRIRWFDRGAKTNAGQHHHAWIFVDFARRPDQPPKLILARVPTEPKRARRRRADTGPSLFESIHDEADND
jgi:hypothetical protein